MFKLAESLLYPKAKNVVMPRHVKFSVTKPVTLQPPDSDSRVSRASPVVTCLKMPHHEALVKETRRKRATLLEFLQLKLHSVSGTRFLSRKTLPLRVNKQMTILRWEYV